MPADRMFPHGCTLLTGITHRGNKGRGSVRWMDFPLCSTVGWLCGGRGENSVNCAIAWLAKRRIADKVIAPVIPTAWRTTTYHGQVRIMVPRIVDGRLMYSQRRSFVTTFLLSVRVIFARLSPVPLRGNVNFCTSIDAIGLRSRRALVVVFLIYD